MMSQNSQKNQDDFFRGHLHLLYITRRINWRRVGVVENLIKRDGFLEQNGQYRSYVYVSAFIYHDNNNTPNFLIYRK